MPVPCPLRPANCEFDHRKILQTQRKSGSVTPHCIAGFLDEWRLWAETHVGGSEVYAATEHSNSSKADKMPKLTETYVRKIPPTKSGTDKHWDSEVKGFVLFVGKTSKTWYFQKDVGGQTKRVLIGRYPLITAQVARQTALGYALEWGRGSGKKLQMGVPTLEEAMEVYLARPKLRSDEYRSTLRSQFDKHLRDWLKLPLDEISKSMVVERHRALEDRPSMANHTLKYFRTIWNHTRRTYCLTSAPLGQI